MDKKQLIERLNDDLALEYKSIVQSIAHVASLKGAALQNMLTELQAHLFQEIDHALTLAKQIDFLGGTPTTEVPAIESWSLAREALEQDLALEQNQLERLRQRSQDAAHAGFPDVAEALSPVLAQTQDHVRELTQALGGQAQSVSATAGSQ